MEIISMMNFYKVCVNYYDGVAYSSSRWLRNMKDAKRHGAEMKRLSKHAHTYNVEVYTLESKPNKQNIMNFLNMIDNECH